jgi:DNA-binding transcriptional LysR family regulator
MSTIDSLDLVSLNVLVAVAVERNFAAAGRRLGLSRAQVSRTIAELEHALEVPLCRRTTRSVVLTEVAEELVSTMEPALDRVRVALLRARSAEQVPAGRVRLSVSHALARRLLIPRLSGFLSRYPAIILDLVMTDTLSDVFTREADIAIRMGPLPDTSMIARKVAELPLALVSTPELLARHVPIETLSDLDQLPAIGFRVPSTGQRFEWPIIVEGAVRHVGPTAPVIETNSIEGVVDMVLLGCGIGMVPRYLVSDHLSDGRLVSLLDGRIGPGPEVHVCFASREHMPDRFRRVADFCVSAIREGAS